MIVEYRYLTGPEDKSPKWLAYADQDVLPSSGHNYTYGERIFRVLEVAWRMEDSAKNPVVIDGQHERAVKVSVVVLVGQIGGPGVELVSKPALIVPGRSH